MSSRQKCQLCKSKLSTMSLCVDSACLVKRCNNLARMFYSSMGYQVPIGYRFDLAHHPHELGCWNMASMAFEDLLNISMDDVLTDVEEELDAADVD